MIFYRQATCVRNSSIMIEDEQLNSKRSLEDDDDEVLNIINNSSFKKLKDNDEDDMVMSIIESSLQNKSTELTTKTTNGDSPAANLNDTNNNESSKSNEDDEVLNIIENSISKTDTPASIQSSSKENNDDNQIVASKDESLENANRLKELVPKAAIHKVETEDGCLHEVVSPLDIEYKPLRNFFKNEHFKPAKEYPFTVDPFQREAILCIENNESVLGKNLKESLSLSETHLFSIKELINFYHFY